MSVFQLGDDQEVDLEINGVDDAGNQVPAVFVSPVTAVSSDDTVVTAAVSGNKVTLTATGKLGTGVSVAIKGDGGAGVASLDTAFVLDVITTAETGFAVVAGTPRHKAV